MENNNSFEVVREIVEEPVKNIMELYVQYIREGVMTKDNAKKGIEEYGFLTSSFENMLSKEGAEPIREYRKKVINWAKSVIDDLEIGGEE